MMRLVSTLILSMQSICVLILALSTPLLARANGAKGASDAACASVLEHASNGQGSQNELKWGHFSISEDLMHEISATHSITLADLKRALSWLRATATDIESRFPKAIHLAIIDVPGRGKFRVHFRSLGAGQGSRILGLETLLQTHSQVLSWSFRPALQLRLEKRVPGWSQNEFFAQVKWMGADLGQLADGAGVVFHFNSALGIRPQDLQISFTQAQNHFSALQFDAPDLYLLEKNVRAKLDTKHGISHRDLGIIFSKWNGRAAREKRAKNLERERLPRYWLIAQGESDRLLKVVFAWDAQLQQPIVVSAFDASLNWLLEFETAALNLL